jgi:hypothetical protein
MSYRAEGEIVMERSRRRFLKILGISTLGLGTISSVDLLAMVGEGEPVYNRTPEALVGKRWALVVDANKLDEETTQKAIEACHRVHNVPSFDDEEEIKWIWTDQYEHVFPGQEHAYLAEEIEEKPFLVLCNHSALCAGVSYQSHLAAGRRDCDDGSASLHWLPLLYGRMSFWGSKFQLERSQDYLLAGA